jgi:hypothetical protein
MTPDRRKHPPVVTHQTGSHILQSHIEQLRHTLLVEGLGMSVVQVAEIQREIADLEKLTQYSINVVK